MKNVFILPIVLLLASCAQGGTVMLLGDKPAVARPTSEIELVIEDTKRAYKVIAIVNTSAKTSNQLMGSTSEAETAALKQLKIQAAQAGADAVINIKQEHWEDGAMVSSFNWGRVSANSSTSSATGFSSGFSSMFKSREIIFKGQAVKWK